jgi:hypothetical protein
MILHKALRISFTGTAVAIISRSCFSPRSKASARLRSVTSTEVPTYSDDISGFIEDRMGPPMDVFHCAIWEHDPVIVSNISIYVAVGYLVYLLLHECREILRMNPLPHRFVIRKALLWIEPQDSKHFLGPVNGFTHTRLKSTTTGVSQPLGF